MIKIQASSVHRIMQCPQSAILEKSVPYELQVRYAAEAADRGKRFHSASERVLRGAAVIAALKAEGIERNTDEWIDGKHTVGYYTKYVKKIAKKNGNITVENKIELVIDQTHRYVAKYDAMVWDGSVLHVFDLKTGNMDYSGSAFDQLLFTAWLIMHTTKRLVNQVKYVLHIVQPNYYDESHRVVCESGVLTREKALDNLLHIMTEINEAVNYWPGDHCTFCPALPICPSYHNNEVINMNTEVISIENISDEQLEKIVLKRKEIEKFLSACEEYAKNKLAKGHTFNHIQIVTSRGKRKWIDDSAALKELVKRAPHSELMDSKMKSPAQIEKLLGKDALDGLTEQSEYRRLAIKENLFEAIG